MIVIFLVALLINILIYKMKKKIMVSIAFIICRICTFSQAIDTCRFKINYITIHHYDTTQPSRFTMEETILEVGNQFSKYQSIGNYKFDSILNNPMLAMQYLNNASSNISASFNTVRYYNFHSENTFFGEDQIVMDRFFVKLDLPKVNWLILNDTTTILGLHCQKAIGTFKGRTYFAWFAKDLPVSVGPWKFKGLPGTILKVEDEKKQVSFSAYSFEKMIDFSRLVVLPKDIKIVSYDAYKKTKRAYTEDTEKYFQEATGAVLLSEPPNIPKRPIMNNPIELTK